MWRRGMLYRDATFVADDTACQSYDLVALGWLWLVNWLVIAAAAGMWDPRSLG